MMKVKEREREREGEHLMFSDENDGTHVCAES